MASMTARFSLPVFAILSFVSAFLLFSVQPMIGKMLLPLVGGTPAGWVVAMAFFQLALLMGYFLAHGLSKLPVRAHGLSFLGLLFLTLLFLPFNLKSHAAILGEVPSPLAVLALLALSVSLPFTILSASAPTIQRLFASTPHARANDPYFLYAASNLGSLIGLFSYPLVIEPFFTLTVQAMLWKAVFMALAVVVLAGMVCVQAVVPAISAPTATTKQNAPDWKRRLNWVLLAFIPSSLMLGVTMHITTDLVAVPMIWVVPLGIYLLTYIFAFARKTLISANIMTATHILAVATAIGFFGFIDFTRYAWQGIALNLAAFGITALYCHRRLAADRPDATQLTEFYLLLSLGGALGGMFNAFIIPAITNFRVEYHIILVFSLLLNPAIRRPFSSLSLTGLVAGALGMVAYALISVFVPEFLKPYWGLLGLISFILMTLHPRTSVLAALVVVSIVTFRINILNHLFIERNFFGQTRVYLTHINYKGRMQIVHYLFHGSTTHGLQVLSDEELAKTPTTYFVRSGPVGSIFKVFPRSNIGVIGLGAGTLACYPQEGRHFTFYEIDPAIVYVARKYFAYLKLCAPDAKIILGDGRLELAKTDERYDILFLDAFSSDTIPTHLITAEAMRLYLEKTSDDGLIIFNVSNRFLDFAPLLASMAAQFDLQNLYMQDRVQEEPYGYDSQWMVLARKNVDLSALKTGNMQFQEMPPSAIKPWTDDHSNILDVVRW